MITPNELDVFQKCRLQWKFQKQDNTLLTPLSTYELALKRTIFQMYTLLQEKNKLMQLKQIKERWDKNWYKVALDEHIPNDQILDLTVNGWLTLEDYWYKYYAKEELSPVGINFEFSTYIYDIHYRIHIDLALLDKNKHFVYRQFNLAKNEWQVYNNLSTKLEIVGLQDCLKVAPKNLKYFDLESRKTSMLERNLNINPDYLNNSVNIINDISISIKNKTVYPCISGECKICQYSKQCWT